MNFSLNADLLEKARRILFGRELYWVIGGSCAGKSTVCRAISKEYGLAIYDVDKHVFEDYPNRCTLESHPALKTWFSAPDPFVWLLGLSEGQFQDFNRASTAEYLDLISDDLAGDAPDKRTLVDGGISRAVVLAHVAPVNRIVCLNTTEAMSVRTWEESADRHLMKDLVFRLPDPEKAWKKFLRFDALMTRTMLEECAASGIRVFARGEGTEVKEFAHRIWEFLEKGPVR